MYILDFGSEIMVLTIGIEMHEQEINGRVIQGCALPLHNVFWFFLLRAKFRWST